MALSTTFNRLKREIGIKNALSLTVMSVMSISMRKSKSLT